MPKHPVCRCLYRPHELLSLKIGDVIFHNTDEGKVYATVTIGKEGKTIPRTLPIINSIPYLKDWLTLDHPHGDSKNHFLFPSMNRKSIMRNKKLDTHSLNVLYSITKTRLLRVLEDPNIPNLDKDKIRELLTKPFNPYLRRHIGITEKARQIPEHSLRLYSGWTKTSKMPEVYTHELGNEISNQILELEGYSTKSIESNVLKSRICPNCQEPNKPETKFCLKCRMVLSYDEYTQVIKDQEIEKQNEITSLKNQVNQNTESNRILASTFHDVLNLLRLTVANDNTGSDTKEQVDKILSIKNRLKQKGIRLTGDTIHEFNDLND